MHTRKNQSQRNTRHNYTIALKPTAEKKEVKDKLMYFYCSRATIVEASDNRLKAYCCK